MSDPKGPFARFPSILSLAPGLFVSKSRQTKSSTTDTRTLSAKSYDGTDFSFVGISPLGVNDLRVLQAIYVLASHPSNALELEVSAPRSPLTTTLAKSLNFANASDGFSRAKVLTCSVAELADVSGYKALGGGGRKVVNDALSRLAEITVICQQNSTEVFRSTILATAELNPQNDGLGSHSDTLAIAISPCLSTPLLASSKAAFVRITQSDMQAFSKIETVKNIDSARLIHTRLCGFINHGQEKMVSAATLAEYAFGKVESKDTARRQYQNVRDALEHLKAIGWMVAGDDRKSGERVYTIKRPAQPPKTKSQT